MIRLPETQGMTKDGLSELVTEYWPDLRLRLGNLLDAFCETVQAGAAGHQLRSDLAVARFCSLCCALGPNFERKPENEWALAILADERLAENVKVHQLVVRASAELKARQGAGHGLGDEILRADGKLLDATDAASRAASSDWVPVPRLSCDVEAVDIRLLEIDWRGEYQYLEGSWQWVAVVPESPSVRVTADVPAPPMVCILSHGPGKGAAARIQVRLLTHALCDHDRHPVVEFAGAHGLTRWHGHAARAVSWRVECLAPGLSTNAMGVALVEETLPATSLVRASACGLRDVGVPVRKRSDLPVGIPGGSVVVCSAAQAGGAVWNGRVLLMALPKHRQVLRRHRPRSASSATQGWCLRLRGSRLSMSNLSAHCWRDWTASLTIGRRRSTRRRCVPVPTCCPAKPR
jgi:hypothetical protein